MMMNPGEYLICPERWLFEGLNSLLDLVSGITEQRGRGIYFLAFLYHNDK